MARKILIIDDEPMILESISYNLKCEGYDVITAGDGETGLNLAKTEKVDLILLDLMLPGYRRYGDMQINSPVFRSPYYYINRQR